jgi:pimeloyl-ACP methyl ester carboxylesterase
MRGSWFCLILLAGAWLSPAPVYAADPSAAPAECPEIFFDGLGEVDCFTVRVPERHEAPDPDHQIELFVSVLHSTSENPLPDPVVYLAGGPGSPAAEVAGLFAESTIRATRDVILIEQRGTALADPFLGCPALDQNELLQSSYPRDEAAFASRIGESAAECSAVYEAEGVDLGAYSTVQNADNVEAVRLALDIEQWNLYGVSYGTRLGLEVMRRHPEAVRSAVLDSVYAPDAQMYRDRTPQLAAAFAAAASACDADSACSGRFGSLDDLLDRALDRWRDAPIDVSAPTGPVSSASVLVDAGAVAGVVYSSLLGDSAMLPLNLEALAHGRTQLIELTAIVPGFNAEGMRLSVECAERIARLDLAAQAVADASDPDLALAFRRFPELVACPRWPVEAANGSASEPVGSDVPVLLISGAFDPVTPPSAAAAAAASLPNSQHHVVRFGGHSSGITDPCAIEVRDAFLVDPNAGAAPACRTDPGPPFVTDVIAHPGAARAWMEIWARRTPWARAPWEIIGVGIGAVCASVLMVGGWRLLRRKRSTTWLVGMVASLLVLSCRVSMVTLWASSSTAQVIYGLPASFWWLPWLGVVALVAAVAFGAAMAVTWLRRRDPWKERMYLTVVAAADGLAIWLLASYGLIGIG